MSHDTFESERFRVERVLDILEHAAARLEARGQVPTALLQDAVAFLLASENAAYEETQQDDSEPTLSACLDQIAAGRHLLTKMQTSAGALEKGDDDAALRFVRQARDYIERRRTHLRLDDRLFTRGSRRRPSDDSGRPIDTVESAQTRDLYDRLIDASAVLDLNVPTAFPVHGHDSGSRRNV